jgi:hypothetical protein
MRDQGGACPERYRYGDSRAVKLYRWTAKVPAGWLAGTCSLGAREFERIDDGPGP